MTDGTSEANADFRRNLGFYYDLVKANVERIVKGLNAELEDSPVTAVGVTPGWLRSEKMLESFGVTEANWRDACSDRPGFGISESPTYVARGVAALATAADSERLAGTIASPRQLAEAYGVTDTDGSRRTAGAISPPTGGSEKAAAASTSSDSRLDACRTVQGCPLTNLAPWQARPVRRPLSPEPLGGRIHLL